MKRALSIAVFVCACGGGSKTATDPNTSMSNTGSAATTPDGSGTPCAQEIALVCPDGQIDGCLKTPQEGSTHACVAK
ncbi:MAG: hypothetical protein H0V17_09560 [Deltaproteobacteria bacterium]|nr:hypothetical protein [Deltaproteobacteria bacterium]